MVLSLLDGPEGRSWILRCLDLELVPRLMRRVLAYRPGEFPWVTKFIGLISDGALGHGPVHLLLKSAAKVGFLWKERSWGWDRPGLPVLSLFAGPVEHFRAAALDGWRDSVSDDLCARQGFGVELILIGMPRSNSLPFLMFGTEMRDCGEAYCQVGMERFSDRKGPRSKRSLSFLWCLDGDGHFFVFAVSLSAQMTGSPEFAESVNSDKTLWPRCLLWRGWLPALSACRR